MSKMFQFLTVLFALLFVSSFHPSAAGGFGPCFRTGSIIAIYLDASRGTQIQFSDVGTAPTISTGDPAENENQICDQGYSVCVDGNFEVGAMGQTGVNLNPSPSGGSLLRPFFYPGSGTSGKICYLAPVPLSSPSSYDLSQVPKGKLIYLMEESLPAGGACLGVRTTFIWDRDGQTLCKLRKWFNRCPHNTRITAVKEYECICEPESEGPGTGTGGSLSVTISEDDEDITFWAVGNSGWTPVRAKLPHNASKAGRVGTCSFDFLSGSLTAPCDFFNCDPTSVGSVGNCAELFLSFLPGGIVLKPIGQSGSEKVTTVCLHILNRGDGD